MVREWNSIDLKIGHCLWVHKLTAVVSCTRPTNIKPVKNPVSCDQGMWLGSSQST